MLPLTGADFQHERNGGETPGESCHWPSSAEMADDCVNSTRRSPLAEIDGSTWECGDGQPGEFGWERL